MAEAVVALSLASNILQILDYGAQFVTTAWRIWKSGQEGVEALTSLQTLSQNLKDVSQRLQVDLPSCAFQMASNNGIFMLAGECRKAAQDMLDSLEKIGLPAHGMKREAVKAAFRLTWKGDNIKALQARFDGFRSQLILNIVASLRLYAMRSLENQDMILQHLSKSQADSDDLKFKIDQMTNRHKGFGSTVVGYLTYRRDLSESAALERSLRDSLFDAVYNPSLRQLDDNNASDFDITEDRKLTLQKQFLSKICYEGMDDRALTVAEAHKSTFRWIFEAEDEQGRPWANFQKRLETDQQLYWITGKAGSGKSTLMKFISQPDLNSTFLVGATDNPVEARCMKYLRRWAREQPLLVVSFYFWAAGSRTQTSKAGLFRTLLHQILEQYPEMIPHNSPERWEALCLFNEDPKAFTEDELRNGLYRAVQHLSTTTKLCLFIDGLDEFDGDHGDLIELFKQIINSPSIKVCVASRPWVVSEDALKNRPSLMLEDLTFNDIKEYVIERFAADANFTFLQSREHLFADNLIDKIVRKATGVFLWVNLVVSSLLDGMKFGDRVSDLQRRLDSLPPDLDALYGRILDNLDLFYFEHAAQYFRLMATCHQPPSAILLSFADEDEPDFALKLPIHTLSPLDTEIREETMRRRLNSRCKGLIEIGRDRPSLSYSVARKPAVQYLHKTVKDYIEKPNVQQRLLEGLKFPFDPQLRLCSANLALYKVNNVLGTSHDFRLDYYNNRNQLYGTIVLCMRHASQVSTENVPDMLLLLDELRRAVVATPQNFSFEAPLSSIAKEQLFDYEEVDDLDSIPFYESNGNTFLSLAVKCGVVEYIKAKAESGCFVRDGLHAPFNSIPQLQPSNRPKFSWRRITSLKFMPTEASKSLRLSAAFDQWQLLRDAVPSRLPDALMVLILLQKGADPNYDFYNVHGIKTSIWISTLAVIIGVFSSQSWDAKNKAT